MGSETKGPEKGANEIENQDRARGGKPPARMRTYDRNANTTTKCGAHPCPLHATKCGVR